MLKLNCKAKSSIFDKLSKFRAEGSEIVRLFGRLVWVLLERLEIETLEKVFFFINKIYENIREIQVRKQTFVKYDGFFPVLKKLFWKA